MVGSSKGFFFSFVLAGIMLVQPLSSHAAEDLLEPGGVVAADALTAIVSENAAPFLFAGGVVVGALIYGSFDETIYFGRGKKKCGCVSPTTTTTTTTSTTTN